jgi:hypothetical protein
MSSSACHVWHAFPRITSLTTVLTAYPIPPLLPFLYPPIDRAASGPGCGLHLYRGIHLAPVCVGVVIDLHV